MMLLATLVVTVLMFVYLLAAISVPSGSKGERVLSSCGLFPS